MEAEILVYLGPILLIIGVVGLKGLKTWSEYKLKMRETPDRDSERLTEAVQQLQEEVAELHERMDFTERVLSEVRARKVIGPGDST